jgi:opacity protein-like surface antigen
MKMTMRKAGIVATLVLLALFVTGFAAFAAVQPVNFGQDHIKMQWYLVNYGEDNGVHFANARKYYTNPEVKAETIELIVEKFGTDQEMANGLYFTEYGYVYSKDGKAFAVTYINHYDMVGNLIRSTEYEESSREFIGMSKEMIPFKAYPYATGKAKPKK